MKSKKSRIYGIVGLTCLMLAVCLVIFQKDDAGQIQTQTKIERVKKEAPVAKAKVRQRQTPQPVEITLSGFKSSWDNEK